MNKTYCIILLTILLAVVSCTDQCNIAGNSTVASLDGRMLYLRTSQDGYTTASLDSCEVIHGRFSFSATSIPLLWPNYIWERKASCQLYWKTET